VAEAPVSQSSWSMPSMMRSFGGSTLGDEIFAVIDE
jgi:hypothetical protein